MSESKIGGFGSMTMQLALHLKKADWEVKILVPRRKNDPKNEFSKGIPVYYFSRSQIFNKKNYEELQADIYHSQHQTFASSMARFFFPGKIHIVTCRDPRSFKDWVNEYRNATFYRKLKTPVSYLFEESLFATWAVKKADAVACPALYLVDKIRKMYGLRKDPVFLPNLEEIPQSIPEKNDDPTVCWVGRFAKRKNPEGFLDLAVKFPHVNFLIAGKEEETSRQKWLEDKMHKLPNVKYLGFKNKFTDPDFYKMYDRSWVLINTSTREGLPLTFIEAAGRGCAILSYVNPDGFAERFGYWARDRDFASGLRILLENRMFENQGRLAHDYVKKTYNIDYALEKHISLYKDLLNEG